MRVLLVSAYELGRQPFGIASAAAWLSQHGHQVECADLSSAGISEEAIRQARLIGFHLPMHTAARMARAAMIRAQEVNPSAHLCGFGLYATLNESHLRAQGLHTILGGEFEASLAELADKLAGQYSGESPAKAGLAKLRFLRPDRSVLPPLESYAKLRLGAQSKLAAYTEASRGCKHLCRHCPIVPVYQGVFRVVQAEVVLEDIRQQVAMGATHVTFGDPDFFNGPLHALRIAEALHREFPQLTYDATIKIEHLRKHRAYLPRLRDTGCLFITSAVESFDDAVLKKLEKGHTRADFLAVLEDFAALGLILTPTFIPFTPWTTLAGYREFLSAIASLDLVENVSPVQLALRLLIPAQSRLLELEDVRCRIVGFDEAALVHCWRHADPRVDETAGQALCIAAEQGTRRELFSRFWELGSGEALPDTRDRLARAAIPYMDEPWYC